MKQASTPCSAGQAADLLQSLPERFRASVAGSAFKQIIGLLEPSGSAALSAVATSLFPEQSLAQARSVLSTQIANRAYTNDGGLQPLKLCISRKSKFNTEQRMWFEAVASLASDAPLDTPRYEASSFTGGLAQEVTSKEIDKTLVGGKKEQTKAMKEAVVVSLTTPDKQELNTGKPHPIYGLGTGTTRGEVVQKDFVSTHAHVTEGFETLGKAVTCLNAMLHWASDTTPKAPRLLALLGDYGTGKTSHVMQLDRVLNGLVAFPADMVQPATMPKPALIDLALLAGVENMAYLSLTEILTVALNKRRSGAVIDADTLIKQAKAGEVVMLYDGLDELLKHNEGHSLHNLLDQLLRVLESDPVTQKPSKAKIMVSCRTHYFRDLQSQHAFFDTRRRGVAQANDYLCLSLLPWNALSIKEYLGKRLNAADASALYDVIKNTYNLEELASKPVLLSMMCEQVEQLLREKESGQPVTASRLYSITVAECLGRDNGKHTIKPHHKPLLMGALATAMWNEGVEQWSADKLDGWLARTVPLLFPNQYSNVNMGALQDDLRTATFIVRQGGSRGQGDSFNFSHRSFQEYFIARWLWDCTNSQHDGLIDEAVIRQYLPRRELNIESTNFAREIWQSAYNNADTQHIALRQSVYLWRWLQCADISEATVEINATLFKTILALDLAKKPITQSAIELFSKYLIKNQAINLQNVEVIQERWEDLDFSPLPSVDFRNANLLCLRAWRCNFGAMLCDEGNWAQTVFRDCEMGGMDWGSADKGGMMIRFGERKPITKALKGPWSIPMRCNLKKMKIDYQFRILKDDIKNFYDIETIRGFNILIETHLKDIKTKYEENLNYNKGFIKPFIEMFSEKKVILGGNYNLENIRVRDEIYKLLTYTKISRDYLIDTNSRKKLRSLEVLKKNIDFEIIYHDNNTFELTVAPEIIGGVQKQKNKHSFALFDADCNLLDYDDEAADTWLFCLASGRPEPVETALPVD